jgi:N-acyl-D-aspartate/D-glutamate deacylase
LQDALPGFGGLDAGERLALLADPRTREALSRITTTRVSVSGSASDPHVDIRAPGEAPHYESWTILESRRPDLVGLTLAEAAARLGRTPIDVMCDLVIADELTTTLQVPLVNLDAAAVAELTVDDITLVGLGDSGAHVESATSYTYPTKLLRQAAGGRTPVTMEIAVRRITSDPARFFGIAQRGELTPGYFADVCVVDLDRLEVGRIEVARDLPGGASRLHAAVRGYDAVLVNGQVTLEQDRLTGCAPGRAVRG